MPFTAYAIPAAVALLAKGVIYYFARTSGIRNTETQLYLFFLFSLSIQNLSELTFFAAHAAGLPSPSGGILYFSASIMALPLLVHLCLMLALDRGEKTTSVAVLWYTMSAGLQVLLWSSSLMVSGFVPLAYTYTKVPGPLYFLFEIYVIGSLITVVGLLVYGAFTQNTPSKRLKNETMLVGLVPFVAVAIGVVLMQHFAPGAKFNTTATLPLALTFFLGVTWHATHQYRLFDIQFYWPWSSVRKRKTAFYRRIRSMIAEIADLETVQIAAERLSSTLRCPVAFVTAETPTLAAAGNAEPMLNIPRSFLGKIDHIIVANELADRSPESAQIMKRHRIATVVPFHPNSQYAAGWLLLGDSFNEQVYSRRDFAAVEELFDKMADLFLDKLLAMRAELTEATRRIDSLEHERSSLIHRVSMLQSENADLREIKQTLMRQQASDSLNTETPTTSTGVTIIGRDKSLVKLLRRQLSQVEHYVSPRSPGLRRTPLGQVVVYAPDTANQDPGPLFQHVQKQSALALYGSIARAIVDANLPTLRGRIVEVLPAGATEELLVRRVRALAQLQTACWFTDPQCEPLIGTSPAFTSAMVHARRLAKFDEAITIISTDIGQGMALGRALHLWSGRSGRVVDDADKGAAHDTFVSIADKPPHRTNARLVLICSSDDTEEQKKGELRLRVPPLSERAGDAAFLIHYFTLEFNLQAGTTGYLQQHVAEEIAAEAHTVAELKQAVFDRLQTQDDVCVSQLPIFEGDAARTLDEHLAQFEARIIQDTLTRCGGNKSKTARQLGLRPNTLHYKLERYGLTGKT